MQETFSCASLPRQDQLTDLAPLETYTARDGTELALRRYPCHSHRHLIMLHGSSAHSVYLHPLAHFLSQQAIANVYLPDLRGHGPNPPRRGDIDYIGQLEDDLADLVSQLRQSLGSGVRFVMGGHSSGGGMALRFAASEYSRLMDAYVLLSPFLSHKAPTTRKNSGGWAQPFIPRILLLSLLNLLGVRAFNATRVLRFNLPERYHSGAETLTYSYRLMQGMHPHNYLKALRQLKQPLLTLVGSEDESFVPEQFAPTIQAAKPDAQIEVVQGASHLGMVVDEQVLESAGQWIGKI